MLFRSDHLRAINQHAWIYRRAFSTPTYHFRRARLLFEGVDYYTQTWLNEQAIGSHEGHFAPFIFDITEALKPSGQTNILTVRVTSPWDPPNYKGSYPIDHVLRGLVKGLYEHGEGVIPPHVNPIGIWRPIWLLLDQGLSIDQIRIRTDLEGNATLWLKVTNATGDEWRGSLGLEIEAENHSGRGASHNIALHLPPGIHEIEQTLSVDDVQLWWPWDHGQPSLYRLRAHLYDESACLHSSREEVFGFRSVELVRSPDHFEYRINGRPVFIRGSSYIPGLYLSQCDEAHFSRDLALARGANLNLIRIHVHVSPPELYRLCDRQGMLIWQDFELNWVHDSSPGFEVRARILQREMIDLLSNHPSIITWSCHNEPTMLFTRRQNLEQHPDPALYADAVEQDPTRPVFICSGQMDGDWQRSGDSHSYYGAIWSRNYTDVVQLQPSLSTEFGFEAPASQQTLELHDFCWQKLRHLEGQIDEAWRYQADLTQFHVEHFRRLRASGCAGYIHFWLVDLVPQVGCGVLDSQRQPKGGYDALSCASQPLQIALEHDGRRPGALWVFNDTMQEYPDSRIRWCVYDHDHVLQSEVETNGHIMANTSQYFGTPRWPLDVDTCAVIALSLMDPEGQLLAYNRYLRPFQRKRRPKGYPWKFDFELGTKVYDRADAPSMVAIKSNRLLDLIPLSIREHSVEWMLRQRLPHNLLSLIARAIDGIQHVAQSSKQ